MPKLPPRSDLSKLWAFVRPQRARIAVATLLSALGAAAAAAYAYLVGPLLQSVLTRAPARLLGVTLSLEDLRLRLPLALVAVAAVKALASFGQTGLMQDASQRILTSLRRVLFEKVLRVSPQALEAHHSGEVLSRFTADVAQLEGAVAQALGSYVKDGLQLLVLLGLCLSIDARLFLVAFVLLPSAGLLVGRFAKATKRAATQGQASLGELSELLSERLTNLAVVRAFRAEDDALTRFERAQGELFRRMDRSLFVRGAFTPTLEFLAIVGVALCIGYAARALGADPALSGRLVSFLGASLLMYQPLKALSGSFSQVVAGLSVAGRLFEITELAPARTGGKSAGPLTRALEFQDASYTYPGGRTALRGVRLRVPAGSRVALVGASGAGKTTVFSALLGFLELGAGRIVWDGVGLDELDPGSVRAQLGWVPQEPLLFSGTLRDNLSLGVERPSDDALWEALRRAHADGFVRALPHKLDQEVGERGAQLSGGQRQRLAIARAILQEPSLLLLDEPTSALDAGSEHEVQAGLRELCEGRTVLVIAHRLSTVRDADLIYVLDQGEVVESGTHAELSAQRGRYAELLEAGAVKAA